MTAELTPVTVAADDLRASAEDMEQAAWRTGLTPEEPLGIWVVTLRRTLTGLADLTESQAQGVTATVESTRALVDAEIAKLRTANEGAALAMHEAKLALSKTQIEADKLTLKTLQEIVPKILGEIREAVVIKERRYNRHVEWRRFGVAALAVLCLVLGGYAWRAWQDRAATAALSRCVENPLAAADGTRYCARRPAAPVTGADQTCARSHRTA